jgi:hypothetical protein
MSFLDKLNQTLNKAGEKANEMANVAKIKMDISKYNGNINSKYQRLGEMIYKSEKEGMDATEEKLTFVNEIDLLFEEIKKLNVQLAEIGAEKEMSTQATYEEPQEAVDGKICPNCGKANELAAVFCAGCGTKIG